AFSWLNSPSNLLTLSRSWAATQIFTPKTVLFRLADLFQKRTHPSSPVSEEANKDASKVNISIQDLKTISTALLHYKRNLARIGEMEKAEGVGKIDQKFYNLILNVEG
ncbi:MAG: hypothetical protein AAFU64_02835, partial [Bacteroidota bacterium]